ncbi:MAG TPA: radical SAM protein [Candidatus Nanoarchaeia archaeon]|nr:radical SAM protein [Candidatus Nanoarchaeia archaeon]
MQKRILLVFPPYSMKERYHNDVGENIGGHLPPLGLCYIAAYLEKHGHEVEIMDCPAHHYTIEDVLKRIRKFQPDIVGLAAVTILVDRAVEITKAIKNQFSEVTVIIGGPHPTEMPEETLSVTGCDIVIKGEAEYAFLDIVNETEKNKQQKIVQGRMVENLDDIPMPARHLVDMSKYSALPNSYKVSENVIQVMTTRGCPYTCTFCADANGRFRRRSVEKVIAEIKHLQEVYGTKEIAFWDDVFTLNKKWVLEFCKAVEQEKITLAWSCYSRVDAIDEDIVTAMAKAGCWNMFFGLESGNQELLDNIKKRITLDMTRKAVAIVKKAGIEVRGSFILGLPGETPEMGKKTIDFAIEVDPDYAQFSIATPFPGTELYETVDKWGTMNHNYKDFHIFVPVFVPKGYKDAQELHNMQRLAFKKFYFRPKYMLKRATKIKNMRDVRRHVKGLQMVLGMSGLKSGTE